MDAEQEQAILRSIAANVRRLREARGLSQAELAERAGVDFRAVQRVETAEVNSRVTVLVALAVALDATMLDLLEPAPLTPRRRGRPARPRS
ncbi:MAG: helix-turn-helix domain-containing protein [Polyangiales bacterium]